MNEPNGDLTREEREAIARLPREAPPPPALEDATVASLVSRGLLRGRRPRRRALEWGLVAAAAVALFVGGYFTGQGGRGMPAPDLPRFLLLLYEGPEYRDIPPGREAERVREYGRWAAERGALGQLESGEKLSDDGGLRIETDGSVSSTPPSSETRLTGFFMIRAPDDRSALEIARTCPHVRYGGSIVIREIDPT